MRDAHQQLDFARETLRRCLAYKIDNCKRALIHMARAMQARSPARELMMRRNRFVDLHRRFVASPSSLLEHRRHRFREVEGILRLLRPDAPLHRGQINPNDDRGKLTRTVKSV